MANGYYTNERTFLPGETASGTEVDNDLDGITAAFDKVRAERDQDILFTNPDFPDGAVIADDAVTRAGKLVGFDGSGAPTLLLSGFSWRGDWLPATIYNANDLIRDAGGAIATNSQYICKIAHISASDLADDWTAGYWELYLNLADVDASENASAASAAAAATSETNAADSAATIPVMDIAAQADWHFEVGGLYMQGGIRLIADEGDIIYPQAYAEGPYSLLCTSGHGSRPVNVTLRDWVTNHASVVCEYTDTGLPATAYVHWTAVGKV